MKTNKIWWSLLVALMLPLSFALTACSDDDDDDKDGGSGNSSDRLNRTEWYGTDDEDNTWFFAFYKGEFESFTNGSVTKYYVGMYSISGSKIKLSGVEGDDNNLRSGSYSYELSGRKGHRDLIIFDALRRGGDLYLVEYNNTDDGGSDDDWDEDW